MRSKMVLIVGLFLCMHHSNAQRAFTDDQIKKQLPKKVVRYKLSKHPFDLSDTTIVSPTAVYVQTLGRLERQNYEVVKGITSYAFMRFFSDGRVFISFAYLSYPSVTEFNDLSYGKYGRYVLKDGEIIVEFYMNSQYGVMFMFAKPTTTGVQFYATAYKMNALIRNRSSDGGYYRKDFIKY